MVKKLGKKERNPLGDSAYFLKKIWVSPDNYIAIRSAAINLRIKFFDLVDKTLRGVFTELAKGNTNPVLSKDPVSGEPALMHQVTFYTPLPDNSETFNIFSSNKASFQQILEHHNESQTAIRKET